MDCLSGRSRATIPVGPRSPTGWVASELEQPTASRATRTPRAAIIREPDVIGPIVLYPRAMSNARDPLQVQLHFLRHAHAGDPAKWRGPDELRPLSAKGRQQAESLGRHLDSLGLRFDLLLSSPLVRARQTAAPVAGP